MTAVHACPLPKTASLGTEVPTVHGPSLDAGTLAEFDRAFEDAVSIYPFLRVSQVRFLSCPSSTWLRESLHGKVGIAATELNPRTRRVTMYLNDTRPLRFKDDEMLAPSTRTAYGVMMHEMGHVFFGALGLWNYEIEDNTIEAFARFGLTPREVAGISGYAASAPSEAWAELFSMYHTMPERLAPQVRAKAAKMFQTLAGEYRR